MPLKCTNHYKIVFCYKEQPTFQRRLNVLQLLPTVPSFILYSTMICLRKGFTAIFITTGHSLNLKLMVDLCYFMSSCWNRMMIGNRCAKFTVYSLAKTSFKMIFHYGHHHGTFSSQIFRFVKNRAIMESKQQLV